MRRSGFEPELQPLDRASCLTFLGQAFFEKACGKAAYYHYTIGAWIRITSSLKKDSFTLLQFLDFETSAFWTEPGGWFHE